MQHLHHAHELNEGDLTKVPHALGLNDLELSLC